VNEHAFFLGNECETPEVALLFKAGGKQLMSVNSPRNNMMWCARNNSASSASHDDVEPPADKEWREGEKNLAVCGSAAAA
jgi:hypothetical protein